MQISTLQIKIEDVVHKITVSSPKFPLHLAASGLGHGRCLTAGGPLVLGGAPVSPPSIRHSPPFKHNRTPATTPATNRSLVARSLANMANLPES